jgi:hypothetical protein
LTPGSDEPDREIARCREPAEQLGTGGKGPSVAGKSAGAPTVATRVPSLISSFFGSGVPE